MNIIVCRSEQAWLRLVSLPEWTKERLERPAGAEAGYLRPQATAREPSKYPGGEA